MSNEFQLRPLGNKEFTRVCRLAYSYCGLNIEPGKEGLVAARLGKIMRRQGIDSFTKYIDTVEADATGALMVEMIDHLTTNHTHFFRELQHFEFLQRELVPLLSSRGRLDLWSAACSTGEEPYSLLMALFDAVPSAVGNVQLLATDISTRVLETAREGIYPEARLNGITPEQRRRHMLRGSKEQAGLYRFKPELRQAVRFERVNLMERFPSFVGHYPLILCRNAMIYFDAQTQAGLVERFTEHLEPGGYLFIGHSESLNGLQHHLEYVQPAIYRRPKAAARGWRAGAAA